MIIEPIHSKRKKLNPFLKLALEMGPLAVFFVANLKPNLFAFLVPGYDLTQPGNGLFAAAAAFMLATLIALVLHYALTRYLPIMPLVSGAVVAVFSGLSLYLHDDTFFKMKATIVNSLFGAVLLGGLLFNRALIAYVLDSAFSLTDEGWRKLTFRWGLFFFFLAILNEIVWRNFSSDFWATFKVFGIMPITMVFAASQVPLLMRYEMKETDAGGPSAD